MEHPVMDENLELVEHGAESASAGLSGSYRSRDKT
jgi:hypothetical protein